MKVDASRSRRRSSSRPVRSCWYRANTAARRWSVRRRHRRASATRATCSRPSARLDLHAVADVDEQRDVDRRARLERGRLVPPPDAVSPRRPGSVSVTSSSTEAGQLEVARLAVDEQHVDLVVGLRPAQRVGDRRLGHGELLVGLGVHEVRVGAVGVEELHLARLGAHRAELLARAERLVDHVAVAGAAQLRAHERAALAGLDVLELEDLEDRPVDLDVVAVLELVRADHGRGQCRSPLGAPRTRARARHGRTLSRA